MGILPMIHGLEAHATMSWLLCVLGEDAASEVGVVYCLSFANSWNSSRASGKILLEGRLSRQ